MSDTPAKCPHCGAAFLKHSWGDTVYECGTVHEPFARVGPLSFSARCVRTSAARRLRTLRAEIAKLRRLVDAYRSGEIEACERALAEIGQRFLQSMEEGVSDGQAPHTADHPFFVVEQKREGKTT